MPYEKLKSRLTVADKTIPNRIVFPPVQTNYAAENGEATERLVEFYGAIAAHDVGLTIVGSTGISQVSRLGPNALCLYTDEQTASAEKLFARIKEGGSVPAVQLNHGGRLMQPDLCGGDVVGPSAIPSPATGVTPRALETDEVADIIDQFVSAAKNAVKAGAEMVEIHGAHSYLLNQFLSPVSNQRSDQYGGNTFNRGRIVSEILGKTRSEIGKNLLLGLRMSVDEYTDGGLTVRESIELINRFTDEGLDILHVSAGGMDSGVKMIEAATQGDLIQLAGEMRRAVSIPVIAVGGVIRLEQAEKALEAGLADMVAIGRGLIADPEMVSKSIDGRIDEVNECTSCNECFFSPGEDSGMTCAVNSSL